MTKPSRSRNWWLCAVALILVTVTSPPAREPDFAQRVTSVKPDDTPRPFPSHALLGLDSIPLETYSFDDGLGGPDPMGWTTADFTLELGTYFHVDDFAGLGGGEFGGLNPLEGSQSLWCGSRVSAELCHYAALPGYGQNWRQFFTSASFPVSGDVTVSFLARFDSEIGYDFTSFDYMTRSGRWQTIAKYTESINPYGAIVDSLVSETIRADSLDGSVQIRFLFTSDGAFDDQDGIRSSDGAVIIDSLLVADTTGVVDFQDFEIEAAGDLGTADGDWAAGIPAGFGDFAALFDGNTVLQEDSLVTNTTYFWGFFLNSPDVYYCGGHSEQAAVPVEVAGEMNTTIDNAAVSPVIDITSLHADGALPDSTSILVAYDVYKHSTFPFFPFDTYVRETVRVRSYANGCWGRWFLYGEGGGTGQWWRRSLDLTQWIDPATTHVQIALGAFDVGGNPCHTQAPLYDNVTVYALAESVATAVGDPLPAAAGYALHQNYPNPFNPTTRIRFDVSAPGAYVSIRVYDVGGRLVRILHDRFTGAGPHATAWDGTNIRGERVSSGVYFYRLVTPDLALTRKMVLLK